MRITDAFLGEHGVFYAQFTHFESALADDDLTCVQRRAALLATGLEPHAQLENTLLFDMLEARAGPLDMLEIMRAEHLEIEAALNEIQRTTDLERARELLREMIAAARDHFLKEELVAFPIAEEHLSRQELEELGQRWAEQRGVRLAEAAPGFTRR